MDTYTNLLYSFNRGSGRFHWNGKENWSWVLLWAPNFRTFLRLCISEGYLLVFLGTPLPLPLVRRHCLWMALESLEKSEGYPLYRAAMVRKSAFFAGLYQSQSLSYAQYIANRQWDLSYSPILVHLNSSLAGLGRNRKSLAKLATGAKDLLF